MTIYEAIKRIEPTQHTAKGNRLLEILQGLADQYGRDHRGPWRLVRSRFHGGGEISQHRSPLAAARALAAYTAGTDCTCGCAGIVAAEDQLPGQECNDKNGYSPYALTER